MSQENVELVRKIFTDFERGDLFTPSAEWFHLEFELVFADGPSPGTWTGFARAAEGLRDWLSPWEDVRVVPEEYRELDDERVLVLCSGSARGKRSGLELDQIRSEAASLVHVRDGTVTRLVIYWQRENAFADLGLPE
jgi:ketosteroid isomerase-like protein